MTTLVTGATGMLGQALMAALADRRQTAVGAARRKAAFTLDLTDDSAIASAFSEIRPTLVVNCAAATDIEACERDGGYAWDINARAVAILAQACKDVGARLVQISTDHFFTDDADQAHTETAPVTLVNNYARSKYAGEAFALTCPGALVLRTNIIGFRGWTKLTFVESVIDSLESGQPISLFSDAYASSIDVGNGAKAVLDLVDAGATGILNLASRGVHSKKTMIENLAKRLGHDLHDAKSGSVFDLAVRRAESLGLDVTQAETALGRPLPTLDEVLDAIVDAYAKKGVPA